MKLETLARCAAHIAQDPLDEHPMHVFGIMHVQARLLDGIGKVGPRQGEVLECANNAAVESWVSYRCPGIAWKLRLRVHRRGRRLAVTHARAIKDVVGVLFLQEEEPGRLAVNLDPEEEVHGDKILHRELIAELIDDVLQKG